MSWPREPTCLLAAASLLLVLSGCNITTLDDHFVSPIAGIEFFLNMLIAAALFALLLALLVGFLGLLGAIGIQLHPTPRMRAFTSGVGAVMLVSGGALLLFGPELPADEQPSDELAVEIDEPWIEVPVAENLESPADDPAGEPEAAVPLSIDPSLACGGACSLLGGANVLVAMGVFRRRRRRAEVT